MAEGTPSEHDVKSSRGEHEGKSIPELLGDLVRETQDLIREEFELAKAEMSERMTSLGLGVGMWAGAGVAALLALWAFSFAAILALDRALDAWLAAAIVGAFWVIVAAILFAVGRNRVKAGTPPVPQQTVETLKEDVQWAKNPTQSGTK